MTSGILKDFFEGFFYPFKTFKFFTAQPKIILYSLAPILINLIIYTIVFFFSYRILHEHIKTITGIESSSGFWTNLVYILLVILLIIILLFICYFLFTVFGGLITAPFNEEISQLVEKLITSQEAEHKTGFWVDAAESVVAEVKKTVFYILLLIPLFLINLIPFIGSIISALLGIFISSFYNALDFIDYPMTRKKISFRTKLNVLIKGGPMTFGFGLISFLFMLLPVINVFTKPLLVVSGTSLYYHKGYSYFIKQINN